MKNTEFGFNRIAVYVGWAAVVWFAAFITYRYNYPSISSLEQQLVRLEAEYDTWNSILNRKDIVSIDGPLINKVAYLAGEIAVVKKEIEVRKSIKE